MVPATSSGVAKRPRGTASVRVASRSGLRAKSMSVATGPGATTLAVIERLPNSRAIERARPTKPALEAA